MSRQVWDIRMFRDEPVRYQFFSTPHISLSHSFSSCTQESSSRRPIRWTLANGGCWPSATAPTYKYGAVITLRSFLPSQSQVYQDPHVRMNAGPYMNHLLPRQHVHSCRFAPFEDVLGVGHSGGFASLVIPGANEKRWCC